MAEGGMGFKHANVEAWHICLVSERFALGVLVLVLVLGVLRIRRISGMKIGLYIS
jgi:hypothetical protein